MPGDFQWTTIKAEGPTWLIVGMVLISIASVVILTFILGGQSS